jgi:hypothetical protein
MASQMKLCESPDFKDAIAAADQCKILCYGTYPTWEEIERSFSSIRNQL